MLFNHKYTIVHCQMLYILHITQVPQLHCGLGHLLIISLHISCKAWNSPIEYPSRGECKHDIKDCEGNMFNPIFKENVQGRKHPCSCALAEPERVNKPRTHWRIISEFKRYLLVVISFWINCMNICIERDIIRLYCSQCVSPPYTFTGNHRVE